MRAIVLVFIFVAAGLTTAAGAKQAASRAGLVVQYADGSVETACVAFPEDEISGLELLERSGLPVVTQASGVGAAVCKIGADGCDYPAESCFCERDGPRAVYWAYQVLDGGGWRYASLGAANVRVRDGDVNGWAWGAGDSGEGAQPPALGIDAICAPPASPTVAVAAVAAPSPAPADTAAASPQATAAPTAAAMPADASSAPSGYLAFAAIAAVLIAGAAVAALRRRGGSEGP